MATATRPTSRYLKLLLTKPQGFEFHQAIRFLDLSQISYRFCANQKQSYAVAAIETIECHHGGLKITSNFLNLTGNNGALPDHFTELLHQRKSHKDFGLIDFLDIFNHRLKMKFIQYWQSTHYLVGYELSGYQITGDKTVALAASLSGLKSTLSRVKSRELLANDLLVRYAGVLSSHRCSPSILEQALKDQFQLPITINSLIGSWVSIHDSSSQLSRQYHQLGKSTTLGRRLWQSDAKFEVEINPVDYQTFVQLMPGQAMQSAVGQLVELFKPPLLRYQLKVVLHRDQIPSARLGGQYHLGWNAWLKARSRSRYHHSIVISMKGKL